MLSSRASHRCLLAVMSSLLFFMIASSVFAGMFPGSEKIRHADVIEKATRGEIQDLIVVFDESEAKEHAASMRFFYGARHDTPAILREKSTIFRNKKQEALNALTSDDAETIEDYDQLPMMFLRVKSEKALRKLLAQPGVVGIYTNEKYSLFLNESLPLIGQPVIAEAGFTGAGTAVVVVDSGLDYTNPAFGACTGENTPGDCLSVPSLHAGCRVVCVHDFAADDGLLDDFRPFPYPGGHGTNVSAIVAGVAPGAETIGFDIFQGTFSSSSIIIAAIDWTIENRDAYNIVAINMSLGVPEQKMTAPCPSSVLAGPVSLAKAAGILVSIASGNDYFSDGISEPACVPGAVSVGAVYDGGPLTPGVPDVVPSFSNSSSFLTLLAPGSVITAGGITMQGTSQAAPHVAGAIAVLSSAFPAGSTDEIVSRLTGGGIPVTDMRNNITKPRLNLDSSLALTLSITGRVVSRTGVPVEGVNMTLSGDAFAATVTGADGTYTFSDVTDGSYTVTPSKGVIAFSPSSRAITVTGFPVMVDDFVAEISTSITGRVVSRTGVPVEGINVTLSGDAFAATVTDADGAYTFSGLSSGSYIVTPSKDMITFTPSNVAVVVAGSNVTVGDFVANIFTLAGKVRTASGVPVEGVAIMMSGSGSGTVSTDSNGEYIFPGLGNGIFTITPSMPGYEFKPALKTVTVRGADKKVKNFNAITRLISGYVRTASGAPLARVKVSLTGRATKSRSTDSKGYYRFTKLPDGDYVVTPGNAIYTFTPVSRNVMIRGDGATEQNFAGSP